MHIFISTFKNILDAKKRIVVPKDFRAVLSYHSCFVAFRSHSFNVVDCFPVEKMEELSSKIDKMYDGFSIDRDCIESAVFADAVVLKYDIDGRVVIPNFLLEYAMIEKEIAFVGKGSYFQLWNPDNFSIHQAKAREILSKKAV